MDTQEILDLLSNARDEFQIALTEVEKITDSQKKEIIDLRKANEEVYKKNVELVQKYGK